MGDGQEKNGDLQAKYRGRLELTWTNKPQRLLAEEDGSYQWVPPADYRVAEVRLLNDAATVGDTRSDRARARDNLLIRGDALNALTSLSELPEFAREYVGKVKLAYIDPPFNTQQSFLQYDDALEHSVWLTMMRDRLLQIKKLLAPDGSVWVHLDDSEMAYCKAMMDEVFGRENYRATVVWQKLYARKSHTDFSASTDFLLVYSRDATRFHRNKQPASDAQIARYKNPDSDPRGPWQSVSFTVRTDDPAKRGEYRYEIELPSGRKVAPPRGRHWNGKRPRYEKLLAEGRLWFGEDGDSLPRVKDYLGLEKVGLVPTTWWPRDEVGDNNESKGEIQALFPKKDDVFQTPKPERLIERIVHIGSEPGDVVLDCFLGSGTTAAVAHKLGRRWIGIENSAATLTDYAIPRLTKVVKGDDPGGITKAVGWEGGGGFRVLDIAPSMFADDQGVIVLADWATNGKLAEATAAQLHFDFVMDQPFCGRKGRTRLAVLDGLVNADVAQLLADQLGPQERLVVCGTAVDPEAATRLRELRPGSRVRKIPASILEEYREAPQWVPTALEETDHDDSAAGDDASSKERVLAKKGAA